MLHGRVARRVFLGEVVDYIVDFGAGEIRVRARPETDFAVGQPVHVGIRRTSAWGCRLDVVTSLRA
jgi:hypothetical protein